MLIINEIALYNIEDCVNTYHCRGHIGCSSGYSLDHYTSLDIITINSQVTEQAYSVGTSAEHLCLRSHHIQPELNP